jgi:two-component system aerobic respiration control sensor histidine kinase ArcB
MATNFSIPQLNSSKETYFNALLNFTNEAIIFLSSEYTITEFNPAAEKLYSIKKEKILGNNYLTFCKGLELDCPLPVDPSRILLGQSYFIEHCIKGEIVVSWTITPIFNNKILDGFLLIGEDKTLLSKTTLALEVAEEHIQGTNRALTSLHKFVTGQTVTEDKSALELATNIYQYMENIIANMPGHVYWLNREGIYLGCNDSMAKIYNLKSRHDIFGKTYESMYDRKSGDFYKTNDTDVMNTGIPKVVEEPYYNIDGNIEAIYLSSKVPLRDDTGNVIGMVGISIDITERKRAEQTLKEAKDRAESANIAKSEFLGVISHEFRTPLTGILGMAKLLSMQNLTPEKQSEYIQHISSAGMHLLNLINDTLDFAKLEGGKFELAPAPMDLRTLIEETCTMLTPLGKAKNLELLIEFDQDTPHQILGDKRVLRQIIINLLGNAIKFTEKGYVCVQLDCIETSGNMAQLAISVSDTGIGIPEDKQGIIFEHFTQVDASHSRRYGGTGLGLTITKLLVELMSGSISVTSQIGKGSTFRCVINFTLQTISTIESPWMSYQSKVRVLIVDDTPRGEVIRKQLSPSNSQVALGREAFNTLLVSQERADPYDIVIIDQKLIGVDPFAFAIAIRKHQELKHIMLVLLTDDGSINTLEKAKSAGYFECIVKPIQPLALQTTLTASWEKWIELR